MMTGEKRAELQATFGLELRTFKVCNMKVTPLYERSFVTDEQLLDAEASIPLNIHLRKLLRSEFNLEEPE